MGKYDTGGTIISGTGGQVWGGTDIDHDAADTGTDTNRPKGNKDGTPPPGIGSTGGRSTSKS